MATTSGFAELPLYRKLALGGAVLLFIDLFLPWLSISVEELDISASANAWDSGLGTFIGILLIVLIGWEVLRLAGNAPSFGVEHDMVTAVLAGVIAVLTLFLFVDVLGDTGIGAWLGIVLLIALGYAAYLAFTAGADREAVTGSPDRAPSTGPATVPPRVTEPDVPATPSSSPAPDVADPDTVPEQRPDDPRREQPPAL